MIRLLDGRGVWRLRKRTEGRLVRTLNVLAVTMVGVHLAASSSRKGFDSRGNHSNPDTGARGRWRGGYAPQKARLGLSMQPPANPYEAMQQQQYHQQQQQHRQEQQQQQQQLNELYSRGSVPPQGMNMWEGLPSASPGACGF